MTTPTTLVTAATNPAPERTGSIMPRHSHRRVGLVWLSVGVTVALAGCATATEPDSSSAPAVQRPQSSSATPAPAGYDISRVDNVKGDFPAGFTVESHPAKTLDQQDIDDSGVNAFTSADIDPAQCRELLIPTYADPAVGTRAAGVRGKSDRGDVFVVALGQPKPAVPAGAPAGCDHASVIGAPEASGAAERIPAPQISGTTTTGVKLAVSAEDPDYIFTAALDNQTSIVVVGSTDPQLNPQQLASDLLVKAVAAVRGQ